jgi:hypothetical protein
MYSSSSEDEPTGHDLLARRANGWVKSGHSLVKPTWADDSYPAGPPLCDDVLVVVVVVVVRATNTPNDPGLGHTTSTTTTTTLSLYVCTYCCVGV